MSNMCDVRTKAMIEAELRDVRVFLESLQGVSNPSADLTRETHEALRHKLMAEREAHVHLAAQRKVAKCRFDKAVAHAEFCKLP